MLPNTTNKFPKEEIKNIMKIHEADLQVSVSPTPDTPEEHKHICIPVKKKENFSESVP